VPTNALHYLTSAAPLLISLGSFLATWTAGGIEALATCLLALFAVIQLLAIRKNNDLISTQIVAQQKRWSREDEIRESRQALNYRFGVKSEDTNVVVWVANLGVTSFLVTRVWVDIANPFDPTQRLPRKKGLEWNAVLAAAETKEFVLPEGYTLGSPVSKDENGRSYHHCEVSIEIEHLDRQARSPIKTFNVLVDEQERLEMFNKPFAE
jgi:hypothetical protein